MTHQTHTTAPATRIVHISTRTRTLGYGWTNQPVRVRNADGSDSLHIAQVDAPDVVGGVSAIEDAQRHAQRVNRGNAWRQAFFIHGQRIVLDEIGGEAKYFTDTLRECGAAGMDVEVLVSDDAEAL